MARLDAWTVHRIGPSAKTQMDCKVWLFWQMYHHLGCEDVTDFRSRLSTSGAPILLVKAECDLIADDNDWLAANTQHPVTHLLAPHQPHGYLQSCGADRAAEASMAQIAEWINKLT